MVEGSKGARVVISEKELLFLAFKEKVGLFLRICLFSFVRTFLFLFFPVCQSPNQAVLPDKGTEMQGSFVNYLSSAAAQCVVCTLARVCIYLLLVCNSISTEIESEHLGMFVAF